MIEDIKSAIIVAVLSFKDNKMQYIVLDLEWNQALNRESMRQKGFRLVGEIIQIGAVRMDNDFNVSDTLRLIVAPKYYKKMHWSVKKLTGITTKSLENGLTFPEAYAQFAAWCGEDATLLTWGPDDIPMLRDNLRVHNMSTASLLPSFDLQRIFARQIAGRKQQFSLADAMEQLHIEQMYPAHDALNDALSTAAVCKKLDLFAGIEHYNDPFLKAENVFDGADGLQRTLYPTYVDMAEAEFTHTALCPACGKEITVGKWIRRAPGKRISLAICSCGAEHIIKVRWKIDQTTEEVFAVKTVVGATEPQKEAYMRALQQRRRTHRRKSKKTSAAKETVTV